MFPLVICSHVTLFLLALFVITLLLVRYTKKQTKLVQDDGLLEPPTPWTIPIIGHLHLLGGYKVPYQAFTALGQKFGPIIKLQLGNAKSLVVNGQSNIREVLVTKGNHFDSRPDFQRYQLLFGGNKENSLAFCDWSTTQKGRRDMLRAYTFPRGFTNKFNQLENIISGECHHMLSQIRPGTPTAIKTLILQTCYNIFTAHFCSKRFEMDKHTVNTIEAFDDIFWEVNQGYAADFLPFLLPLHSKNLKRMNALTEYIREYITNYIIEDRYKNYVNEEPSDYVESLIRCVKLGEGPEIDWNTAMFALEDIIGGHSAVGNFLVKVLGFLVKEPEVQKNVQKEIDQILSTDKDKTIISIFDKNQMPYTEGVIFEAIRLIASPIVPRVANQDSSVNGLKIHKGTLIFLNNYDLSMSTELWEEPEKFKPERFVQGGRFVKPDHFLPFGGGRRSCMGYKMVQLTSFGLITTLLQNFTLKPVPKADYSVPIGSLALPRDTFKFIFETR